jgi:hypothetical protein
MSHRSQTGAEMCVVHSTDGVYMTLALHSLMAGNTTQAIITRDTNIRAENDFLL